MDAAGADASCGANGGALGDVAHVAEIPRPERWDGQELRSERLGVVIEPDERIEVDAERPDAAAKAAGAGKIALATEKKP